MSTLDHFTVVPATGLSQTAGTPFSVTVTAINHDGGTLSGYTGSHTLVWSGPGNAPNGTPPTYPTSVSFSSGTGSGSVTLFKAESTTLTATEGSISGTSGTIVVGDAGPDHFNVTAPANATAGVAFSTGTLTAQDAYNNTAKGYTGSHTIAWSGSATSPAPSSTPPSYPATSVSFTSGAATTTLTATLFSVAGPNVLTATATSPSLTGSSGTITVTAASADHFAVCAP